MDKVLDRRTLREGEVLIREGDLGDVAFFIQSGLFEVTKRDREMDILLSQLGKNSIVGEMALVDNKRRSATVRCVQAGTVVALDRTTFDERLKQLDKFTRALLEIFSNKLRMLNDELLNQVRTTSHSPISQLNDGSRTVLEELLDVWGRASTDQRLAFMQSVLNQRRQ